MSARTGQSSLESNAPTAPSSIARARLASSRDVTYTTAPWRIASASAAVLTPPPMPTISTVSPGATRARRSMRQAVSVASG
jgi:hypothetical protein